MKYVYLAFNWIFGILLLLLGLLSLIESPMAGLFLIAASALMLPPVRDFTYSKINIEFNAKARAIAVFALFIISGLFIADSAEEKAKELAAQQERDKAEQVAQREKENIEYFNANRQQILASVNEAISKKEYSSAISQSNKYLSAGDSELEKMNTQAKEQLSIIEKARKTEILLAKLKSIPAQEYEKNRNLYQQLLKMHPDNKLYKTKVSFYADKAEEEKRRQIAAKERKEQIESQFSAWDGSHFGLERAIKDAMNDPGSYEHVKTVYWDKGDYLIVSTVFRGKNAFGGIVKNSVKAKVSLSGQVIKILQQN